MSSDVSRSGGSWSGPRWLLLGAGPLGSAVWDPVAAQLPGSVWAPIGDDGRDGPRTPAQRAERLAVELMRRGGRWRVVGHSLGGQTALELAACAVGQVETLTLLCTRDTPVAGYSRIAARLRRGDDVDVDAALHRWFRPSEIAAGPDLITATADRLAAAPREAWLAHLDGMAGYDGSVTATRVSAMTTVIAAEHDAVVPPAAAAAMAGRIRHSSFLVLPDAAHQSPFLYPIELADAIDRPHCSAGDPQFSRTVASAAIPNW